MLAASPALGAQTAPPRAPAPAASLEAAVGIHRVHGAIYRQRYAPLVDAMISARLVGGEQWALVAAGGAMLAGVGATGDVCELLPQGGCAPEHNLIMFSALVGPARRLSERTTAKLLVGPASYRLQGETDWGMQARADLHFGLGAHWDIGPMTRITLLPRHRARNTIMWAAGGSLRWRTR